MCSENVCRLARHSRAVLLVLLTSWGTGWARQGPPHAAEPPQGSLEVSLRQLQAQVSELESALERMRAETAGYRAEMLEMRRELEAARAQLASGSGNFGQPAKMAEIPSGGPTPRGNASTGAAGPQSSPDEARVAKLEEEYQLLTGKIDEQYQTKVESASKYRVRLFGIVLLNAFGNRGAVDNLDFPTIAAPRGLLDSRGSLGATLRQSQFGLEVFGAQLAGARARADVQFDFSGGFPNAVNGVSFGVARLRTATLRLDWARTSVVAGQDTLFFSPLTPTSLASLAVPAFSYAGNLWAWVPQVRVERHVSLAEDSGFTFQAGLLAPQTGELPGAPFSFLRTAQAGERSRQPAYATRMAWTHGAVERKLVVGIAGYYVRQKWGFDRRVDGWAGMADWSVPLGRWVSLTGEFYRGRAVGGLEGAVGRSVLTSGALTDPATLVRGLNSTGGWAQVKVEPVSKLEFNAAWGQENPFASDLRAFLLNLSPGYGTVARNRSALANFIYRPRSDLLFSSEFRRLRTWDIRGGRWTANQVNLSMGILF